MGYSALARVMTGWTGSVVCEGVTITPRTRESALSLMARVVHDVLVNDGTRLAWTVSSSGVLTLSLAPGDGSGTFALSASSNTATRLGFTGGPYSGAATYTAAGAFSNGYVPSKGLRLEGPFLAATRGSVTGDSGYSSASRRVAASTRLVMWDTLATPDIEGHELDAACDGRWFGRFVVEGLERVPMGSLRQTDNVRIEARVREIGAGEVVQTSPSTIEAPDLFTQTAHAWLLGYVRTDVPGYRSIQEVGGGASGAVASGTGYRFDALLAEINATAPVLGSETFTLSAAGIVHGDGLSWTFPDRLGWVLGFGTEAGQDLLDSAIGMFVPPAGIPLMGATWLRVESDADRRVILDEALRNQGYSWGGASIWRCRLTMHHWAFDALQTGWCLAGKVTLGGAAKLDDPISTSDPKGAITGYVVGDPVATWDDQRQTVAVVEMTIVSE